MTSATWEKPKEMPAPASGISERLKFIIGGLLLLGAVAFLIISNTFGGAQYFITVDEIVDNPEYIGQQVRISGAVLGDTIDFDAQNLILNFTIVHMDQEISDLAEELHVAVNDSTRTQLPIYIEGEVIPDLLQHEAQAILTGTIGEDGIFYADELLLKCPSRYEEAVPQQIASAN